MESEDLQELLAALHEADAEIEAGHYTDYTEETLHELFADIKRRGREALSLQGKIQNKGQVTIPTVVRRQAGLSQGDLVKLRLPAWQDRHHAQDRYRSLGVPQRRRRVYAVAAQGHRCQH